MGLSLRNIGRSIRDIFDANTEEDQRKRLAAGQPRFYQQQQAQRSTPIQRPSPMQNNTPYGSPYINPNVRSNSTFGQAPGVVPVSPLEVQQQQLQQTKDNLAKASTPVVKAPETPEEQLQVTIDNAFKRGDSWEKMSKDTKVDIEDIKKHSLATRPDYGVKKIDKPQQGNLNKIKDILDANTEADKYRRQQGNIKARAEGKPEAVKAITLKDPGNIVGNTFGSVPRLLNTVGNQMVEAKDTVALSMATAEYQKDVENYQKALASGSPMLKSIASDRVESSLKRVNSIENDISFTKSNYKKSGGLFNVGTAYNEQDSIEGGFQGVKKIAGTTASAAADIYGLKLAGLGGKEVANLGFKGALKEAAPLIRKSAAVNFGQGAADAYAQGGGNMEALTGAATNAVLGTVADIGLASLSGLTRNAYRSMTNQSLEDVLNKEINKAFTANKTLSPGSVKYKENARTISKYLDRLKELENNTFPEKPKVTSKIPDSPEFKQNNVAISQKVDELNKIANKADQAQLLEDHIGSRTRKINGMENQQAQILEQTQQLNKLKSTLDPSSQQFSDASLQIKKNLRDLDEINLAKSKVEDEIFNLQTNGRPDKPRVKAKQTAEDLVIQEQPQAQLTSKQAPDADIQANQVTQKVDKAGTPVNAVQDAVDEGKVFYHGTRSGEVKSLKDLQAGSKTKSSSRNRVYVTENPEIAKNFGDNVVSEKLYGKHLDVRDIGIEKTPGWAQDNIVSPEFADFKTTNLLSEREKRVFENQFVKGVPNNTIIEDTPGIHKYLESKGYTTVTVPRPISDVGGVKSETIIISDKAFTPPVSAVQDAVTPTAPPKAKAQPATVDLPEQSKLGTMTKEFFDNTDINKGISETDLTDIGNRVAKQAEADFSGVGSKFDDVARRVETARRAGVKTLDGTDLTDAEKSIWRSMHQEMNYIRERALTKGKKINLKQNFGEMYFPNQNIGSRGASILEGIRTNMPGNEFKRKGSIATDNLDYSSDVVGSYIARYGDTRLSSVQRIVRALKQTDPSLDDSRLHKAAEAIKDIQDNLNSERTEIGLLGAGKRKTLVDGKYFDTASEMSKVGDIRGMNKIDVNGKARGFQVIDKLNSVEVGGKPLGNYLGLEQWRDAKTFASRHLKEANGDMTKLAVSAENWLKENLNVSDDALERYTRTIGEMPVDMPPELKLARVMGIYQNASKEQLMEALQGTNITNAKTRQVVNEMTDQILRQGSIEQATSAKVVRKILQTQNALFRKANIGSAFNELGDLPSFAEAFGKHYNPVPDYNVLKEFGVSDIDPASTPFVKQLQSGKSVKEALNVTGALKTASDKLNFYHSVETYKAAVALDSSKALHMSKGLKGDALTKAVLDDYRKLALPVDSFTKTFLDNYPLYTQYMTWGARNLQKEGKLAIGTLEAGKLTDMSQKERIARNLYTNLPAKTVFWLASNGFKGTAILTAFGLTDFTGLTEGDFSGIADEDKSLFDQQAKITNRSTTLSLLNSIVQTYEKERLKNSDKYKNADYNPYKNNNVTAQIGDRFVPQFAKNMVGGVETDEGGILNTGLSFDGIKPKGIRLNNGTSGVRDKGYSTNKDGRVQYEAPKGIVDTGKSYVFGKNQTKNAREYSGRGNVLERVQAKSKSSDSLFDKAKNVASSMKDMAFEDVGLQENKYNRPLTPQYSDAYKKSTKEVRTNLLQGGRKFNDSLDNLKKNDPNSYQDYIKSMDGNHVQPEFWREIVGKDGANMSTFKTIRDRKKQLNKDLGVKYDPLYDLPDDQAKAVLEVKSAITGNDIAIRNVLSKEQWYKDYNAKVKQHYKDNPSEPTEFKSSSRVKKWDELNDKYSTFYSYTKDDGSDADWSKNYPLVARQKRINKEFGFDSPQSKAFFKANSDGYKAQKEAFDGAQLDIINQMRKIEGHPPMSADAFKQANAFVNTDDKKSGNKYASGGGKGRGSSRGGGKASAKDLDPYEYAISLKAGKTSLSGKAPAIAKSKPKVTAAKSTRPKVSSKRSKV